MNPPTADRTTLRSASHLGDLATLKRLPCIDEMLEQLDQLERADSELAGLTGRTDIESMNRRRWLAEVGDDLRTDIAREISMIRGALRASVVSDYPPGNLRSEDLALLERLLDADALDKLEELNQSASHVETATPGERAMALERDIVDSFVEGLRCLS